MSRSKINFARILAGLTLLGVVAAFIFFRHSAVSKCIREQRPIYGLLIGTDFVDNSRHSDTIVIARYDPAKRFLDLLSIPRDTKVDLPELRVKRINQVYAYSYRMKKDEDLASRELIKALKFLLYPNAEASGESVPDIAFYAEFDYNAFRKTIDILGGIDVMVDEPMNYDDNWGNLHIHFSTGAVHLNGQKALEYVRFRGGTADYGRMVRQQEFLLKVIGRLNNPISILKIPKILSVASSSVKSNLSFADKVLAVLEMRTLTREKIRLIQLPGTPSKAGYWIPNPEGLLATAKTMAEGGNHAVTAEVLPPAAELPKDNVAPPHSKITVEVWNASSREGLALKAVKRLRSAGFDVVKWGNYDSRQQRTFVRDHRGETEQARAIAAALSGKTVEVFTSLENNPLVDVEVVLGEDYQTGE